MAINGCNVMKYWEYGECDNAKVWKIYMKEIIFMFVDFALKIR